MLTTLAATQTRYRSRVHGASPDWTLRTALLARYTGGRRLALLQLDWSVVCLDRLQIEFMPETTKGGYSGRCVPLHPCLAAEMRGWGPFQGSIIRPPAAELTGRGHVDRTIRRAWERAGVRERAWHGQPLHVARKTIRSHMVAAGVQADVIDAYLGHAGEGTGGRSYTDRDHAWLWQPLVDAVATIPVHRLIPAPEDAGEDDDPEG